MPVRHLRQSLRREDIVVLLIQSGDHDGKKKAKRPLRIDVSRDKVWFVWVCEHEGGV